MTGTLFGIAAAIAIAVSDFAGGAAARRDRPITVTAISQVASVLLVCVLLLCSPPTAIRTSDVLLGVAGGVVLAGALQLMYKTLARGAMGILSAVIGVATAIVPFAWALGRDESLSHTQWVGAGFALVAVAVAGRGSGGERGRLAHRGDMVLALFAGTMFGLTFVTVGSASEESQLVPVLAMRISTAVVAMFVCFKQEALLPTSRRSAVEASVSGIAGTLALALFVWASHERVASSVAVLQALAPLGVALLAFVILGQRLHRSQAVGIALAVGSAMLFAL